MKWFKQSKIPIFCPFYHAVSDKPLAHLQQLYPLRTSQQFEKDLDYFLKHFQAISIEDIPSLTHQRFKKPPMLLSFDDGLSSFGTIAAPILLRKGVPAINFLNSAFVDNKQMLFRFKTSLILEKLNETKKLKNKKAIATLLSCTNTYNSIKKEMMAIGYNEQQRLDPIANILNLDFQTYLKEQKPYLKLVEIKALEAKGFHFGAHSVDHPLFYKLPFDSQIEQASESIKWLEKNLNTSKNCFSFPFTDYGVKRSFFETLNTVVKLDYTFGCAGLKLDTIPYHFQRLAMECNLQSAQSIIRKELSAFYLKKLIHKHQIKR